MTHPQDEIELTLRRGAERGRAFRMRRWLKGARYELIDLLADGGMGLLLRARDHRVGGNLVLIKAVKYDTSLFGYDRRAALYHIYSMRQRFRREARVLQEMALRGLNHVPALNDFFCDRNPSLFAPMPFGRFDDAERLDLSGGSLEVRVDQEPYLVMERIYGQSVSALLPTMDTSQLLWIAAEVCRLLERIHRPRVREDGTSLGFLYMDLKPDNLLVDRQGGVRLVDFGAAVPVVDGRRMGTGALTPGFAAPELRRIAHPGAVVDGRADLYSLGAILFQGLGEGRVDPMSLASPYEDEFPTLDPATLRRDLHPLIRSLVTRALQRDPADRFRDAAQMREAIERALREV
jgi:serine/threonine protein kinase